VFFCDLAKVGSGMAICSFNMLSGIHFTRCGAICRSRFF
jgi:hypothetical protein